MNSIKRMAQNMQLCYKTDGAKQNKTYALYKTDGTEQYNQPHCINGCHKTRKNTCVL